MKRLAPVIVLSLTALSLSSTPAARQGLRRAVASHPGHGIPNTSQLRYLAG